MRQFLGNVKLSKFSCLRVHFSVDVNLRSSQSFWKIVSHSCFSSISRLMISPCRCNHMMLAVRSRSTIRHFEFGSDSFDIEDENNPETNICTVSARTFKISFSPFRYFDHVHVYLYFYIFYSAALASVRSNGRAFDVFI